MRTSALTRANARRNVDSSAGPRSAPSTASTSGPASEAHCPIAANDRDPAITAAIPTASSPASACRRPRFFRGSGTWARRPRRCWQRAAAMGEDVIGGRCPSWQAMVSVKNFHRSARARPPPADTQDESSAVTTSQVTPSTQDFAVSRGKRHRRLTDPCCRRAELASRWRPARFEPRPHCLEGRSRQGSTCTPPGRRPLAVPVADRS